METWKMLKLGGVAVLAIFMIVLIAQNTAPVETRLVFVTVTMPRAALLFVTLLVGVVLGIAIAGRILPTISGEGGGKVSGKGADVSKPKVEAGKE